MSKKIHDVNLFRMDKDKDKDKYKMRLVRIVSFLVSALVYFAHSTASAADFYGECFGCSYSQKEAVAVNSANQFFNERGDGRYRTHIIDLKNRLITSFDIWNRDGNVTVSTYSTPSNVDIYMLDLKDSLNNLSAKAGTVVIPKTVLDSAWRYTSCAYCKNDIRDYIQGTLSGQINAVTHSIVAIAQAFNLVNSTLPNQFVFPLQSGGKIIIELGISAESDLTIQIVDVIDGSNNSVPITASSLRNLQVRLESGQAEVVNGFINQFSYYVPLRTGSVTIKMCPTTGCITNKP